MFKRIFKNVRSSSSRRIRGHQNNRRSHNQDKKLEKAQTLVESTTENTNTVVIESLMDTEGLSSVQNAQFESSEGCSPKLVVLGVGKANKAGEEEDGSTASTTSASSTCSSSRGNDATTMNALDTVIQYRQMGSEMDETGDYEKAKEYLEFALSTLPQVEDRNAGDTREDENEDEDCQEEVAQEQEGEICLLLGHILYKTEDYKFAIQRFSRARDVMTTTLSTNNDDEDSINSKIEEIEYLIEMATMMMGD